jgi:hypothetical protein
MTYVMPEDVADALDSYFGQIIRASQEERNMDEFIESQRMARAMYIVVQIVLEDILPEIEIRPKWRTERKRS